MRSWTWIYGAVVLLFTVYTLLDTFVITRVYTVVEEEEEPEEPEEPEEEGLQLRTPVLRIRKERRIQSRQSLKNVMPNGSVQLKKDRTRKRGKCAEAQPCKH